MIIDVWSDVVCPWCFIGKKRLEKALEGFEHKEQITIRHRLLLWAETIGKQDELLTAMYSGYFENSKPVFSHPDLCAIAESIGINPVEAMNVLESAEFTDEVIADRNLADQLGASGVPFFVVDMKYGISGAQPLEHFVETINAAWNEKD